MKNNKPLENYMEICRMAGRDPIPVEFMAWSWLGVEPEWYKELTK